ncbi:MAG: 2OG-Fe(II) oxygenase [Alphaproteobacteria bacterium]
MIPPSGQPDGKAFDSQDRVRLLPGDPAPRFSQRATSNPRYVFDTVAGRYIVLCFFASAGDEVGRDAYRAILDNRLCFDDTRAALFGVSIDPVDETAARVRPHLPGIRFFWDFDLQVSRLYGAVPRDARAGSRTAFRRFWLVLDPMLRVLQSFPLPEHEALFAYLAGLPPPARFVGFDVPAPVLILPNVFEPEFCRHLIALYERGGGGDSGFMTEIGGRTVLRHNPIHKVRRDCIVTEPKLIGALQQRVVRRIVPEIQKAFQFNATRMERYLIGCYSAEDGGHFAQHRDNTTAGTVHRRFAVSINLNAEFDGGEISFPEYGGRPFKPPPGGAVVFSCSLLHAVSTVTQGRRYAFLPFLYDDAAAAIREANAGTVEGGIDYKASG